MRLVFSCIGGNHMTTYNMRSKAIWTLNNLVSCSISLKCVERTNCFLHGDCDSRTICFTENILNCVDEKEIYSNLT